MNDDRTRCAKAHLPQRGEVKAPTCPPKLEERRRKALWVGGIFVVTVSVLAGSGVAADKATPDFGGYWGRNSTDFEPPLSGPGPVTNKGKSFYARFGDDTNPVLKPEAAERIR